MLKKIVIVFAILSFCVFAFAEDESAAQFRGYTEINRILKERIIRPSGFELGRYVGEQISEPNANNLVALLGTYQGTDTEGAFKNGDPNAFNMTLWHLLLSRLADDIGRQCKNKNQLPVLPAFAAVLKPVCSWPNASAKDDSVLHAYWLVITGYEMPDDEYNTWKTFFLSDTYAQKPAREAVAAMTLAIFYNPYFLLKD